MALAQGSTSFCVDSAMLGQPVMTHGPGGGATTIGKSSPLLPMSPSSCIATGCAVSAGWERVRLDRWRRSSEALTAATAFGERPLTNQCCGGAASGEDGLCARTHAP